MDINFIIFLFTALITGITYSITTPLYPYLANKNNYSDSFIGMIFSLYSLGMMIFIPFTTKFILFFSRFRLLLIAIFLNSISVFLYLFLYFLSNSYLFIIISISARVLQGIACEFTLILLFSVSLIISNPEDSQERLGNTEIFYSIGRIIGPLIVYSLGEENYIKAYVIIFVLLLLSIYFLSYQLTIPKDKLNQISNEEELSYVKFVKSLLRKHYKIKKIHKESIIDKEVLNNDIYRRKSDRTLNIYDSKRMNLNTNKGEYFFNFDDIINKRLLNLQINNQNNCTFIKNPIVSRNHMDSYENRRKNEAVSHNTSLYSIKYDDINENTEIFPKQQHEINENIHGLGFFVKTLLNKNILLVFFIVIFDFICQSFYTPVFVKQMNSKFNVSIKTSCLFLSIFFIAYAIGMKVIIKVSQQFPIRYMLAIGLLLNSLSLIFFNPSSLLPQKLEFSLFGYLFQSFFGGIICLNAIVDFTESLKNIGYNDFVSSDFSSALYILGTNLSELIGPLIGGIITERSKFETACFCVGSFNLLLSLLLFGLNWKRIYNELVEEENEERNDDL